MKYLNPNQATQTLHLTLSEGRQYFSTAFTHYLMIIQLEDNGTASNNVLAQVLTVVNENTRDTEVTLTTVGLTIDGQYFYKVYGQNSASNLDPTNAAVVGLVESGRIVIGDAPEVITPTTPTETIKYGKQ